MEFRNESGGIDVVNRRFRGATFKVAPHFLFSPRVVCILLSAAAPVELLLTEKKSPSDTALTFAALAVARSRDFPESVACGVSVALSLRYCGT
jgi:hypothetical protein